MAFSSRISVAFLIVAMAMGASAMTTAFLDQTEPSTATPIPSPPFYCFDCNSGNALPGNWTNPACTVDGYMESWNTPQLCYGQCFSRVGLYPAGSVFRGCSTNYPGLPFEMPINDCIEDPQSNQYWCFCAGDACNTHNLTDVSGQYVSQYMNMIAK